MKHSVLSIMTFCPVLSHLDCESLEAGRSVFSFWFLAPLMVFSGCKCSKNIPKDDPFGDSYHGIRVARSSAQQVESMHIEMLVVMDN